MGMSASQGRLMALTGRLSDLEFKAQMISNTKVRNGERAGAVAEAYINALNNDNLSETEKNIAEAKYKQDSLEIQQQDKLYDLSLKTIDTEHNAVQTEIDSVKKVIDKNIEKSFKIFDA